MSTTVATRHSNDHGIDPLGITTCVPRQGTAGRTRRVFRNVQPYQGQGSACACVRRPTGGGRGSDALLAPSNERSRHWPSSGSVAYAPFASSLLSESGSRVQQEPRSAGQQPSPLWPLSPSSFDKKQRTQPCQACWSRPPLFYDLELRFKIPRPKTTNPCGPATHPHSTAVPIARLHLGGGRSRACLLYEPAICAVRLLVSCKSYRLPLARLPLRTRRTVQDYTTQGPRRSILERHHWTGEPRCEPAAVSSTPPVCQTSSPPTIPMRPDLPYNLTSPGAAEISLPLYDCT